MTTAEEIYMQVQYKYPAQFGAYTLPEDWQIEAMKEYAQLMIEQDRERVKEALLPTMAMGSAQIVDQTPIILT